MEDMNEKELQDLLIKEYADIQRIKKYGKEELDYQERILKSRLTALGISAEELELKSSN